jgi:hypothetical protein
MRTFRETRLVFALATALAALPGPAAAAQGCIVARSGSVDISRQRQGGHLEAGELGPDGQLQAPILLQTLCR